MGNTMLAVKMKKSQFKRKNITKPSITFLNKTKIYQAGSVIIITGASSGIGRELAINYAARKCR